MMAGYFNVMSVLPLPTYHRVFLLALSSENHIQITPLKIILSTVKKLLSIGIAFIIKNHYPEKVYLKSQIL